MQGEAEFYMQMRKVVRKTSGASKPAFEIKGLGGKKSFLQNYFRICEFFFFTNI